MLTESFESFQKRALAAGADEVVKRRWEPNQVAETHTHPFEAEVLVIEGEMWLTHDGTTRHYGPGGTFRIAEGTPHAERYGSQGATYCVARRKSR
ncbi:MAG TPA: cupin domain-containing protein [Anaeromyxobacteraceae bacterium]|nr:cupin domain-containing protein [Anaeromyxobacteraceae bacterium]